LIKEYDVLIESFLANQIGITDDFLSLTLAAHLKDNLLSLYKNKQLHKAGIGKDTHLQQNKLIRTDSIYWLDRSHENVHENSFLDAIDAFVLYLNSTCYTGITGYEFHYTMYADGDFYAKHIDQFKNNDSRKYSMVVYLNTDWKLTDGGELCIHHAHHLQKIAPTNAKAVFFASAELAHEVLVTTTNRMSITGWLKVN
jgi:SM-20-related protein